MMRLLSLLLLLSSVAHAADTFDLNFPNPVKISELARIVYGDMLGENFIIEQDLLKDESTVTTGLKGLTKKTVDQAFRNVLQQQGYSVDKIVGVNYLRKHDAEAGYELFFYRPKYRSTGYIIDLTSALFRQGKFSAQRAVKSAQSVTQAGPQENKPVDTGTSAYSQQSKELDAFIFRGPVIELKQLKQLLVQIDQPQGEILVKGVVYEVAKTNSDSSAVGLAVKILGNRLGVNLVGGKSAGSSVRLDMSTSAFGVEAFWSALEQDSRFKVVSSPSLRVKSGKSARFTAGSDVPVLGQAQLDRNGQAIQSVEYKPSGIILDLQPSIYEDKIELSINQQLSSFIPTTTGVNNSPTLLKREIKTTVDVNADEVILLGGLEEDKRSDDHSGLWFLPNWLHSTGHESTKTEVLLILQVQRI